MRCSLMSDVDFTLWLMQAESAGDLTALQAAAADLEHARGQHTYGDCQRAQADAARLRRVRETMGSMMGDKTT